MPDQQYALANYSVPPSIEREVCISTETACRIVLVSLFALPALSLFAYQLLWERSFFDVHELLLSPLPLVAAFTLGLLVHEAVHAAGFVIGGASPKSIGLLMDWKTLTAAVTCSEFISARALKITCLLPFVMLGLAPTLVAFVTGSLPLSVWSALMMSTAAGDIAFFWAVRNVPGHCLARVHGSKIGCRYYEHAR